jgi:hypothetical protein
VVLRLQSNPQRPVAGDQPNDRNGRELADQLGMASVRFIPEAVIAGSEVRTAAVGRVLTISDSRASGGYLVSPLHQRLLYPAHSSHTEARRIANANFFPARSVFVALGVGDERPSRSS